MKCIRLGICSVLLLIPTIATSQDFDFRRGDAMGFDGTALTTAFFLISYLIFPGAETPPCLDAADANDDGAVDILDVIAILYQQFVPGWPPHPPPSFCGPDPTNDALDCAFFVCP